MGLVSNFSNSGEDPEQSWTDEILGPTVWSEDDEEWHGSYRGFDFALGYERKRVPSPQVVDHARESLNDTGWILEAFEREKERAVGRYGRDFEEEIGKLRIGRMVFGLQKEERVLVIGLLGDDDEVRAWWMAFFGRECSGIGFDG